MKKINTPKIKPWAIELVCGYKPITTFWEDFSIAERVSVKSVLETYREARKSCDSLGYKYLTELVMALNWKMWEYGDAESPDFDMLLGQTYTKLWREADAYACSTLKGEEAQYFYQTTD